MRFEIALTLMLGAVVVSCFHIAHKKFEDNQDLLQSIPLSERSDFLVYILGHGFMEQNRINYTDKFPFPTLLEIPSDLEEKFKTLEKPKNFARDLYLFVQSTYRLSSKQMFSFILRKRICFSKNNCIDMENIGELCCPF